jgi:hypothetical protein
MGRIQKFATNTKGHCVIHYKRVSDFRLGYVELPAALLDGAPDMLRFRAFAAALLAFLSAKKLVIRADKSWARSRWALGATSRPSLSFGYVLVTLSASNSTPCIISIEKTDLEPMVTYRRTAATKGPHRSPSPPRPRGCRP